MRYTRPLAADSEASADRVLGKDPATDLDVTVKAGRFGPYIQLGEQKDYAEGESPGAPASQNMSPGDMELELALKLLSLPRESASIRKRERSRPASAVLARSCVTKKPMRAWKPATKSSISVSTAR